MNGIIKREGVVNMENKYMYHVPYERPIPYLDRTLLRARNLDIEEYKPVGKWIPGMTFMRAFIGAMLMLMILAKKRQWK